MDHQVRHGHLGTSSRKSVRPNAAMQCTVPFGEAKDAICLAWIRWSSLTWVWPTAAQTFPVLKNWVVKMSRNCSRERHPERRTSPRLRYRGTGGNGPWWRGRQQVTLMWRLRRWYTAVDDLQLEESVLCPSARQCRSPDTPMGSAGRSAGSCQSVVMIGSTASLRTSRLRGATVISLTEKGSRGGRVRTCSA